MDLPLIISRISLYIYIILKRYHGCARLSATRVPQNATKTLSTIQCIFIFSFHISVFYMVCTFKTLSIWRKNFTFVLFTTTPRFLKTLDPLQSLLSGCLFRFNYFKSFFIIWFSFPQLPFFYIFQYGYGSINSSSIYTSNIYTKYPILSKNWSIRFVCQNLDRLWGIYSSEKSSLSSEATSLIPKKSIQTDLFFQFAYFHDSFTTNLPFFSPYLSFHILNI